MSINLYVKIDGRPFPIRQTPTEITERILTFEGVYKPRVKGSQAKKALKRYIAWELEDLASLRGTPDYKWAEDLVKEKIAEIEKALKKSSNIVVWAM